MPAAQKQRLFRNKQVTLTSNYIWSVQLNNIDTTVLTITRNMKCDIQHLYQSGYVQTTQTRRSAQLFGNLESAVFDFSTTAVRLIPRTVFDSSPLRIMICCVHMRKL